MMRMRSFPESVLGLATALHKGLLISPTHTTSELVKLAETEPIGIHDNHNGRIWNIDPDLDNRCQN